MSQNGSDLVTKAHADAVRCCREQDQQTRALVEQMQLVAQAHREAVILHQRQAAARIEQTSIHHTELPEPKPDSPLIQEWNTYRREVGRLLAEGRKGRWVLIHGERIIGTWDSEAAAEAAGVQRFQRLPFLIHQLQEREPLFRGPSVIWR